ncbi:MAG: Ig-like domain-containing domain [Bacteroidetes bacterium]|nr:Ig-like domain-containing domain [Bacteroidota bacterium]
MPHSKFYFFIIKTIRTTAYLLICSLVVSCAQIVAPGGGAKDILPPRVLKYSPDSAQLNFEAKTVEIDFDEFIQLKNLNNQLIISPPMEKAPNITIKNKTLDIELDKNEKLKPSTTYCINFGNALQDLNEGNALENFKYIFSTGSFIDSLKLTGKVESGFNLATEKGVLVMLYSDMSDSVVYKSRPDYFAKTEKDGTFQINNIKAGKYKLAAVKDANSNYKYDGEAESIGFANAPIDISEKQKIIIDLFQEPEKKVYLKKYVYNSYGKVTLLFNQNSNTVKINNLTKNGDVTEYFEDSKNKDSLTYWFNNFEKDSLKLQIIIDDKITDTLEFKTIQKQDALRSKRNPLKLSLLGSPGGNQSFDLTGNVSLLFNNAIKNYNSDSIYFKEDSTDISKNICFELFGENYCRIKLETRTLETPKEGGVILNRSPLKFKENTNYHLLIPPGTFTDVFGLTNDSIKVDFKTREEKYYGSVKLNLTISETKGNYIVQLLDEQDHIVREDNIQKSEILSYEYLYPRKYKLKIIYDDNSNHKWDTGNYLKLLQPEKVIYNSELINIRSNWDADLVWKVE